MPVQVVKKAMEEDSSSVGNEDVLNTAAALLGIDAATLKTNLTSKNIGNRSVCTCHDFRWEPRCRERIMNCCLKKKALVSFLFAIMITIIHHSPPPSPSYQSLHQQ